METQFEWKIFSLNAFSVTVNGLEKVVNEVNWLLTGKTDKASWSIEGSTKLSMPSSTDFIDWGNLTKENVVSWIESVENVQELKNKINAQIQRLLAPESETLIPPFGVV